MRTRVIALLWAVASVLVVVGAVGTTFVDLEGPADLPFGFGFTLLGVGAATAGAVVSRPGAGERRRPDPVRARARDSAFCC